MLVAENNQNIRGPIDVRANNSSLIENTFDSRDIKKALTPQSTQILDNNEEL